MQINQLFKNITYEGMIDPTLQVIGISDDSRMIKPGELFVAISGCEVDGHQFIEQAIENGAVAIVTEKQLEDIAIPYIRVENSRLALAQAACQFYDEPSKRKKVIGVTGTNGKTTTTYMIRHLLQSSGLSCSLFGTIENRINGQLFKRPNTTLSALELQKFIAESQDDFIVVEVSSHGIDQFRTAGIEFDCCLFTNLDHEHLDYHKTMEAYFEVKSQLFHQLKPAGVAIVNMDDPWGERLYDRLKVQAIPVVGVGNRQNADIEIGSIEVPQTQIAIRKHSHPITFDITSPLPGSHNIYNATMATATLHQLGLEVEQLDTFFSTFEGVSGRFHMIKYRSDVTVVVDYAHTAKAFTYLFETAKKLGAKRLIHVFGFRGKRDQLKRKEMISISRQYCDAVILTSDDLNGVSVEEMLNLYSSLYPDATIVMDRTKAIQAACELAKEGDWVLITGKGHEAYKETFHIPTTSDIETVQYLVSNHLKMNSV